MKCKSLFSEKIRKISSVCHLLNLPIACYVLIVVRCFIHTVAQDKIHVLLFFNKNMDIFIISSQKMWIFFLFLHKNNVTGTH